MTYRYVQEHGQASSPYPEGHDIESEVEEGDKIKLILRAANLPDASIVVKQATLCETIVLVFLKKAGIEDRYQPSGQTANSKKGKLKPFPQLCVDGDRLDGRSEISMADLEDGDLVDVVGLWLNYLILTLQRSQTTHLISKLLYYADATFFLYKRLVML